MAPTSEVIEDAMKAADKPFIAGRPGGQTLELMDADCKRDMRSA